MWCVKYVIGHAIVCIIVCLLFIYSTKTTDNPVLLNSANCAIFIYKNGNEIDSYTAEVNGRKDYNYIITVQENNITRVYFKMDGVK